MKKAVHIISAVIGALWLLVFIGCLVVAGTYQSPTGDGLEYGFTMMGCMAICMIAVIGLLSILLFWRAGIRLFTGKLTRKNPVKIITFVLAILTNLFFAAFLISLAMIVKKWSMVTGVLWLGSGFATIILLLCQALQDESAES